MSTTLESIGLAIFADPGYSGDYGRQHPMFRANPESPAAEED
jgi:hypothetical protein